MAETLISERLDQTWRKTFTVTDREDLHVPHTTGLTVSPHQTTVVYRLIGGNADATAHVMGARRLKSGRLGGNRRADFYHISWAPQWLQDLARDNRPEGFPEDGWQ